MNSFVGSSTSVRRVSLAVLLAVLTTSGCDCAGDRLVIVDPDAERVFTEVDDADVDATGLQYDVVVDVTGLHRGDEIRLLVGTDEETLLESGVVFRGINQPNGRATIAATLPTGTVYLVACFGDDDGCSVKSPVRRVTVVGSLGGCAFVNFVTPAASGTEPLFLTGADDVAIADGACGASFATPVHATIAGADGKTATLFIDGIPTANATVANGEVRFASVQLGVRGSSDTSTLTLVVGDDASCATSFVQEVGVLCDGPSCRLQRPIEGTFLNSTLDTDTSTAVLDMNVKADAPIATAGRTFTLVDATASTNLATAAAASAGSVATGTFLGVAFADGPTRFFAECTDGVQATRSSVASYLVDATPCTIDIDSPADQATLTNADDSDSDTTNGIQAATTSSSAGEECIDYRVAACSAIPSTGFTALDGTTQSTTIDLGTSGTQTICAEIRDFAGNIGRSEITVGIVPDGSPLVTIVTPTATTKVNLSGGMGYVADLTPGSTSCELTATVDCSVVGTPVSLHLDGAVTATASATCLANGASSHGGRASFGSLSIPASASSTHSLVARQTVGTLVGVSTAMSFGADCNPPVLTLTTPSTCPVAYGQTDDVGPAAGVQVNVVVGSPNTPQLDVVVRVAESGGGTSTTTSLASSLPVGATSHGFPALDFGGAGTKTLTASASDAFANLTTTTACSVTVTDLPSITLTPLATTTFNSSNAATFDCDAGNAGFDLTIAGTTNATAGSTVTLQIGAGAPITASVAAGGFSACVPAAQGASNVTATVVDTVPSDGTSGSASAIPIAITVSTTSIVASIHPVTITTIDRRAGVMSFSFTALADAAGQPFVSYDVRCAGSPILTEATWATSTVHPYDTHTPGNPGSTDQLTVRGFRTGTKETCSVRGTDGAGNQTAIPNALDQALAKPEFLIASYAGTVSGGSIGVAGARAAGDVNGDSLPDFVVSGRGAAFLYLGQAGGALPVLATTITKSESSSYFGAVVRGIGDFDRDGLNDILVSDTAKAGFSFDGEVYVFYGRASWPASIVVSESTCAASFCVRGAIGSGLGIGTDAAALGNFDGLTGNDLGLGAGWSNSVFVLTSRNDIAAGTAFVVGTTDPSGFRIVGPTSAGYFGWTIGAPGNVIGTSNTDLVVGEYNSPSILYRLAGQNLASGSSGLTTIPAASLGVIAGGAVLSDNFGTYDSMSIATGDFDGDSQNDLFAFTIDAAQVDVGTYVLYGSAAADYPVTGSLRVRTGTTAIGQTYFGVSRGISNDAVFGHVGDIDLDGRDELLTGGVSMTTDGFFSASLAYGRSTRLTGVLTVEDTPATVGVLQPVLESYPTANPLAFWTVGFPGDVVRDTVTSYPDIVVCDPGTTDPSNAGSGDRIFVLY